jgi:hypothetical protein
VQTAEQLAHLGLTDAKRLAPLLPHWLPQLALLDSRRQAALQQAQQH